MAEMENERGPDKPGWQENWGKKLFFFTLLAVLGFFYWLLIYSGGVAVHHG